MFAFVRCICFDFSRNAWKFGPVYTLPFFSSSFVWTVAVGLMNAFPAEGASRAVQLQVISCKAKKALAAFSIMFPQLFISQVHALKGQTGPNTVGGMSVISEMCVLCPPFLDLRTFSAHMLKGLKKVLGRLTIKPASTVMTLHSNA